MSDKPLLERLQVKGERRLAVIGADDTMEAAIGGAEVRAAAAVADVALLFVDDRASLDASLADLLPRLRPDAILWVAHPKLTSARAGDLNRDVIRASAPAYGLDTVSQIAVDQDWSALRLKRLV